MKIAQMSFSAGELSPALYGRVDFAKYQSGAKTLRNWISQKYGGITRRRGTVHIGEAPGTGRLIPFQFNKSDVYVLEFTNLLMRVIYNDGYVIDPGTGVALEVVSPYTAAQLSELHYTQSADTMYLVHPDTAPRVLTRTSPTAWTFTIHDLIPEDASPVDVVGVFNGTAPASPRKIMYRVAAVTATGRELDTEVEVEIPTSWPWGSAEYVTLYWQSLTGNTDFTWKLSAARRTSIRSTAYKWTAHPTYTDCYYCELAAGGNPGLSVPAFVVLGGTQATKGTDIEHLNPGEWVFADEPIGPSYATVYVRLSDSTDPDGKSAGYVEIADALEYYLVDGDGSSAPELDAPDKLFEGRKELVYSATIAGTLDLGEWTWDDNDSLGFNTTYVRLEALVSPTTLSAGGVTWKSSEQFKWVVYKNQSGMYGWVGETESGQFIDDDYAPDFNVSPQTYRDPFVSGMYPSAVCLFQQRLFYAGTDDYPQTLWASQLSDFDNFGTSFPTRGSDSIEVTIASTQINAIRHMVPLDNLVLFTDGAEWLVTHNVTTDYLSPTSIRFVPVGYNGCHPRLQPLPINRNCLYTQRDGHAIRDLVNQGGDGYQSVERSVLAHHLVQDDVIVEWAYQQHPEGVVWCVREDGALLGFTYLPEHDVFAWHRHDTQGDFISVCAQPGEDEDAVYFMVQRTINGSTVYHVEKMAPRMPTGDQTEGVYLDDALTYRGVAATTISGLSHLEGETVNALADGKVVLGLTVSGGVVTLPFSATVAHIGLAYQSDLETLPVALHDATTLGLPIKVRKVGVRVVDCREFTVGPDLDNLDDVPWRSTEAWGAVTQMVSSGVKQVTLPQRWSRDGQLALAVTSPVPATILSITMDFEVGDE